MRQTSLLKEFIEVDRIRCICEVFHGICKVSRIYFRLLRYLNESNIFTKSYRINRVRNVLWIVSSSSKKFRKITRNYKR